MSSHTHTKICFHFQVSDIKFLVQFSFFVKYYIIQSLSLILLRILIMSLLRTRQCYYY